MQVELQNVHGDRHSESEKTECHSENTTGGQNVTVILAYSFSKVLIR